MSLFDVIKYPISNPPSMDELRAIPDEVLDKWAINVRRFMKGASKEYMVGYLSTYYRLSKDKIQSTYEVSILRNLLREYNV